MSSRPFVAPLHGLRAIAAILVVIGHAALISGFPALPIDPSLGVVLFFVLSGYLMGTLYLPTAFSASGVWSYLVARTARIYPLFAVVIVASVLLPVYGVTWFRFGISQIPTYLLLRGDGLTVWTVAVECQFYGLFVILWWLYSRVPSQRDVVLLLAVTVGIGLLILWGLHGDRNALNRYLHLFLMGLGVSALVRLTGANTALRRIAGYALPLLVVAFALSYIMHPGGQAYTEIYADLSISMVTMLLVLCAVLGGQSPLGRLLGSAPLVWLGEISFGIYLLHRPVLLLFEHSRIAATLPPALQTLAMILVTILIAWPAHLLIERPARHAIRLLAARRAATAIATG